MRLRHSGHFLNATDTQLPYTDCNLRSSYPQEKHLNLAFLNLGRILIPPLSFHVHPRLATNRTSHMSLPLRVGRTPISYQLPDPPICGGPGTHSASTKGLVLLSPQQMSVNILNRLIDTLGYCVSYYIAGRMCFSGIIDISDFIYLVTMILTFKTVLKDTFTVLPESKKSNFR